MLMRIVEKKINANEAKLELHGILNLQSYFKLEESILAIIKRHVFRIQLDLTGVAHMDYRGVEILVKRAERLRGSGGDLVLIGVSKYLTNIIQMAGAAEIFKITPTPGDPQEKLFE